MATKKRIVRWTKLDPKTDARLVQRSERERRSIQDTIAVILQRVLSHKPTAHQLTKFMEPEG